MPETLITDRIYRRTHDLRKARDGNPTTPPTPGWVYVSPSLVDARERRRLRRRLVRVVRADREGLAVHRRLRYGPRLRKGNGDEPAEMGLDWDSWLDLLGDDERPSEVEAVPLRIEASANPLAHLGLGHPDPTVHAAALLGLLGMCTGLVGLLISLLG